MLKKYKKVGITEMVEVSSKQIEAGVKGLKQEKISIGAYDIENGSPKIGDMIARDPKSPTDRWLINEKYFKLNYEELENKDDIFAKVVRWAKEKGILQKATSKDQMLKTMEEVGELASALNSNNLEEIKDAIGDIAVTLIIQAHMNNLDFFDCLQGAYDVISKRKGEMVNGVFVKKHDKGLI